MKFILHLLIFLTFLRTHSQVQFCPAGAEWNYLYNNGSSYSNIRAKYVRDTIEGLETIKIIDHSPLFSYGFGPVGPSYIKQKGDTIFFRNKIGTKNTWQILYNFEAQAGQTWTNQISISSSTSEIQITTSVTGVGTTTINGKTLKELTIDVLNSPGYINTKITELLGGNYYLFPFFNYFASDPPYIVSFLCYKDNTFGQVQLTSLTCDAGTGISVNRTDNSYMNVYPNPVNAKVTLDLSSQNTKTSEIIIQDVSGLEIEKLELKTQTFELEVSAYHAGVYFVTLLQSNKVVERQKLVVMK